MNHSFLSLCLIAALLAGCNPKNSADDKDIKLRPVKTITVGERNGGLTREFPGVVDASRKAELAFRVPGKLTEILVNEGDQVQLGQALAELDKTDYQIQLQLAEANYEQAQGDFNRARELIKKGFISSADFDALKAKQSTAGANLETARQNLLYTTLYAPFSGMIAKRHHENFEDIAAGEPTLTLHDLSAYTIKVDVPDSVIIKFNIYDDDKTAAISAIFENIPDKKFPLTFKEVSTQPDPSSQSYEVSFTMARESQFNILPGMSVRVTGEVPRSATEGGMYVPAIAVQEDAQGRFVYLAIPKPEQPGSAIVERAAVTTGELTEWGIAVTAGLQNGDRVIVAGVSKMRNGLAVRLLDQ